MGVRIGGRLGRSTMSSPPQPHFALLSSAAPSPLTQHMPHCSNAWWKVAHGQHCEGPQRVAPPCVSSCHLCWAASQVSGTTVFYLNFRREASPGGPTTTWSTPNPLQAFPGCYLDERGMAADALFTQLRHDHGTLHYVASALPQPFGPTLKHPDFQPVICFLETRQNSHTQKKEENAVNRPKLQVSLWTQWA